MLSTLARCLGCGRRLGDVRGLLVVGHLRSVLSLDSWDWSCQLSALNLSLSRALDRWELDPSNLFPEPALLLRRDRYKTKWQRLPPAEPARKAGRRLEPCIGPAVQHLLLDGYEESSEPKLWSKEEVRIAEHWWSPDWNRRVNMIPL